MDGRQRGGAEMGNWTFSRRGSKLWGLQRLGPEVWPCSEKRLLGSECPSRVALSVFKGLEKAKRSIHQQVCGRSCMHNGMATNGYGECHLWLICMCWGSLKTRYAVAAVMQVPIIVVVFFLLFPRFSTSPVCFKSLSMLHWTVPLLVVFRPISHHMHCGFLVFKFVVSSAWLIRHLRGSIEVIRGRKAAREKELWPQKKLAVDSVIWYQSLHITSICSYLQHRMTVFCESWVSVSGNYKLCLGVSIFGVTDQKLKALCDEC